jgi:hypothetical protein
MTSLRFLFLLTVAVPYAAFAQVSDFQVKKAFEDRVNAIRSGLESAQTMAQLDSLRGEIDRLQNDNASHAEFLNRALHPSTFAGTLEDLRREHVLTYDRTYLVQTQGIRITELESRIAFLTGRLDTLTTERARLFAELQDSRKSLSAIRETVRRLNANLQSKDRLLFALVDSMFLPYGRDFSQVGEMQRAAISTRIEQANVLGRIQETAVDNIRFIEMTQLQAKDYAGVIDQYRQFAARWSGLRENILAVQAASAGRQSAVAQLRTGTSKGVKAAPPREPAVEVDSLLQAWEVKLNGLFWAGLSREFAAREIPVTPFVDAASFSKSIRSYVDHLRKSGDDPTAFVNDVWKMRVDREWRDALTRETMLGKAEYASLDQAVSELGRKGFDQQFILYSLAVIALFAAGWWFFARKSKKPTQPAATPGQQA